MKNLFIGIIFIIFSSLAAHADTNSDGNKVCTGFAKWTEDGEFKTIRSKCITEKEYQTMLNSPDYLCKYYQKSIWKESERAYGKKTI